MPRRNSKRKNRSTARRVMRRLSKAEYPEYAPVMAIAAIEGFGVGLLLPLLVPIARDSGAGPREVGVLSSLYGFVQLFTAPYAGTAADGWNKSAVLAYSLYIVGLSYAVMGLASSKGSLALFFVSRVITGIFKHSSMLQKAVVADMDVEQTEAFGRISFAPILGYASAPLVGGFLADKFGASTVCFLSAGIFIFNGLVTQMLLPSDGAHVNSKVEATGSEKGPELFAIWRNFSKITPATRYALSVRLAIGIAGGIFGEAMSWLLEENPSVTATEKGMIRTLTAVTAGLTGALLMKPIKQAAGSNMNVAFLGVVLDTAAMSLLLISPILSVATVAAVAVAFSSMIMSAGMVALLNETVDDDSKGLILGLTESILAITRAFTPGLSGILLNLVGVRTSVMLSVSICTGAIIALPHPLLEQKAKVE